MVTAQRFRFPAILLAASLLCGCAPRYTIYAPAASLPTAETVSGGARFEAATFVVIGTASGALRPPPDSIRVEVYHSPDPCAGWDRLERFAAGGAVGWTPSTEHALRRDGAAVLPRPEEAEATLHVRPSNSPAGPPIAYRVRRLVDGGGQGVETILVFLSGQRPRDCSVI